MGPLYYFHNLPESLKLLQNKKLKQILQYKNKVCFQFNLAFILFVQLVKSMISLYIKSNNYKPL